MADADDYFYCDKIECNLGESITIKAFNNIGYPIGLLFYGRDGINIYEDGVLIESNWENLTYGYTYTPSTAGTHTIKLEGYNYITVEITVTGGDSGVTWTIGNKEVKSLTINNKIVKSIERVNDGEIIYGVPTGQKLKFTQDEYTATDGECSITCQLIDYDNNDVENKTITLSGSDGSSYTATTDSNGECIFTLIGKGTIRYTANYNDIEEECRVYSLNNKIKIYVSCSRSTSKYGSTSYYEDKLTYEFKYATKSSNYTTQFALTPEFINGTLQITLIYNKKTTSSGSFTEHSKTVNLGIGTSTKQTISAHYSWMTSRTTHCLQCKTISKLNTNGSMWWKFEIGT